MPTVRSRIRRPAPVSETLHQLGDRIRQARIEAGLSQAQLGAPHFTRAYVSAIELGKARPAMKSLEFLADKLGKPVSFFVADDEADRRRKVRDLEIASAMALLLLAGGWVMAWAHLSELGPDQQLCLAGMCGRLTATTATEPTTQNISATVPR